jgi:hypothetical protein
MYYSQQQQEDVFLHEKYLNYPNGFFIERKCGSFIGERINKNNDTIGNHYKLVM